SRASEGTGVGRDGRANHGGPRGSGRVKGSTPPHLRRRDPEGVRCLERRGGLARLGAGAAKARAPTGPLATRALDELQEGAEQRAAQRRAGLSTARRAGHLVVRSEVGVGSGVRAAAEAEETGPGGAGGSRLGPPPRPQLLP